MRQHCGIICFLLYFTIIMTVLASKNDDKLYKHVQHDLSKSQHVNLPPHLLDRKKRYLLFPESSSFQMIFDLIIGVVDYTKFAILGITCAVAWELPSKPPSEILEDVRDQLFNGTLGLQRRNDTVDEPSNNVLDYHYQTYDKPNYYNSQNYEHPTVPYQQWFQKYSNSSYKYLPYRQNSYYANKNVYNDWSGNAQKYYTKPQRPTIRYVFGKSRRRLRDIDSSYEKLSTSEHLISRHKLYGKIKLVYERSGHNGTACVLRALCETGQRNRRHLAHNAAPQGFLTELLRAIYSLPSEHDIAASIRSVKKRELSYMSTHYLEAHNTKKDCKQIYKDCEHTIWPKE